MIALGKSRWGVIGALVLALLAGVGVLVTWLVVRDGVTVTRITAAAGGTVRTPDGVVVRFAPHALSKDADVRIAPVRDVAPPPDTRWVTRPVDISLSAGELRTSATVTLPVDDAALADDGRWTTVVSRAPGGAWEGEGGILDRSNRTITTVVAHFSIKGAFTSFVDIAKTPVKVAKALNDAYNDVTYEAPTPDCGEKSIIWSATAEGGNNVKVCVVAGGDDRPTRLRVVNNRVYPQFLRLRGYPPMLVTGNDRTNLVDNIWRMLGETNRDYTYLPGKGQIELDLPPGYGLIDFIATPGLEAVIAQFVVDVVAVPYMPAAFAVGVIQCVLAAPVTEEIVRTKDVQRLPELGGALLNCVTSAWTTYSVLKDDATDAEKKEAKGYRDQIVNAVTTAFKDVPKIAVTVVESALQGPAGQHVVATRTPILPTRALNEPGADLPAPVLDTQQRLYSAAANYGTDRDSLLKLVPAVGLGYGNAADPDQPQSLTLGQEPDPVAGPVAAQHLALLMVTAPLRWRCTETGRDGYVYGMADPDLVTYPGRLADIGITGEKATFIRTAARLARPYRVCIMADGTWTSFSKDVEVGPFPDAERDALPDRPPAYGDCPPPPAGPFIPRDGVCVSVTHLDLDGDAKPDRFVMYRRFEQWNARAVLSTGAVMDLPFPYEESLPGSLPQIEGHLDLDGVPGEEVALQTSFGAHSVELIIVTYTDRGLTLIRRNGETEAADRFTIDDSHAYSRGIGCSDTDHDGRPELLETSAVFDYDPQTDAFTGATASRLTWTWRGKTLDRGTETQETFTAAQRSTAQAPPYRDLTCNWR